MRTVRLLVVAVLVACGQRVRVDRSVPDEDPRERWSELLAEAMTPEGVDYDHIDENRAVLQDYVVWLGEHGPVKNSMRESKEDRRIAFLVNAYNAFVIEGVLQNRPISSVKDVEFGVWASRENWSFFFGQRFKIDGEWLSLYHLENHRILARYQDPLPHVALNCASAGCPPLRWWTEKVGRRKLQRQMEDALEDWLEGPALVATPDGFAVSEIFFWYEDDFTYWSDASNLCEYLYEYAPAEASDWMIDHFDDCRLERIPYDWSLNAAPAGAAKRKALDSERSVVPIEPPPSIQDKDVTAADTPAEPDPVE